jgi:hypothetical protein
MKSTLFSLVLLFSVFQTFAQKAEKNFILLNEARAIDTEIYQIGYPKIRNWWLNETKGIASNFSAHISETGRTYSMVFIKGDENLGVYVSKRANLTDRIRKELKMEMDANKANQGQATNRSVWIQSKNMTVMVPDFKIENYDFRRITIFTVPLDKMEAYEKIIEQSNSEDQALGIVYNYIVYKAVEGYPINTYMMILPDKSILNYYTHQYERNLARKSQPKLLDLSKKARQLRTVVRIDHLTRVPNQ